MIKRIPTSVLAFVCLWISASASAQDTKTETPVPWCTGNCVAVGGPVTGQYKSLGTPQGWIVGEVRTFAFGNDSSVLVTQLAANGWVECAGQSVRISDYPELWSIMGRTWGSADKVNVFYLPDLRGLYLTGWQHGRVPPPKYISSPYTGDEDTNSRVPPRPEAADEGGVGGPTNPQTGEYDKYHVGMLEADQLRSHNHGYAYEVHTQIQQNAYSGGSPANGMAGPATARGATDPSGGAQTHPANAAVMFFMYLGHPSQQTQPAQADVQKGKTGKVAAAK